MDQNHDEPPLLNPSQLRARERPAPAPERWELTGPAIVKQVGGDFAPQQVWPAGTIVTRPDGVTEVPHG